MAHTLKAWPQDGLVLYISCYANDPATVEAAMKGAKDDLRVRVVVLEQGGPKTKADCLNQLYKAMLSDETRSDFRFSRVLLHDAEDMVHPAALSLIDRSLHEADFVQLPVRPEPQPSSPWVAGHYSDEFAEAHSKSLVVRDALGAAIPAAGVRGGSWGGAQRGHRVSVSDRLQRSDSQSAAMHWQGSPSIGGFE